MRKIFYIIIVSLSVLFLGGWFIYYLHRNAIVKQEVHRDSDALLIIAMDNMMMKNTQWLRDTLSIDNDTTSVFEGFKNLIANSGLHIPPKLFFFSFAEKNNAWYNYSNIEDLQAWQQYVASLSAIDSTQKNTGQQHFVKVNQYVSIAYNDKHVLWKLNGNDAQDSREMLSMLEDKGNRRAIRYFRGIEKVLWDHDIVYTSKDAKKYITANIEDEEINLGGEWHVATSLASRFHVRQIDTLQHPLVFWSALPLADSSLLQSVITPLADLGIHTVDYVDVVVEHGVTSQHDTIVNYDYDEDFNTIEKKEVVEKTAPLISLFTTAMSQETDRVQLKFFYNFYTSLTDKGTLLSTQETPVEDVVLKESGRPFFLRADFSQWPADWTFGPFPSLQKRKIIITLSGQPVADNTLRIQGKIVSKK